MSEHESYVAMRARDDTPEARAEFLTLATIAFDRDEVRLGVIVDDIRVCYGSFDMDAPYLGEFPPLTPGSTPMYFAFANYRHEGNV